MKLKDYQLKQNAFEVVLKKQNEVISFGMKIWRTALKYGAVVILIFMSFACNKYTYITVYNQFDSIAMMQVNSYFIPDENQKKFAAIKLKSLHKWHRYNQLPHYRYLLVYMKNSVKKGISENDLNYFYEKWNQELEISAEMIAPDAAEFVLTLNKMQLDNFIKKAAEHRKDSAKKRATGQNDPAERKAASTAKFLSNLYGDFSSDQIKEIRKYIETFKPPGNERGDFQALKQKELVNLVMGKAAKEDVALFIKNWTARNKDSMSDEIFASLVAERKYNIRLYVYVDKNIVTAKQREKALLNLNEYIKTIDTLMSEK